MNHLNPGSFYGAIARAIRNRAPVVRRYNVPLRLMGEIPGTPSYPSTRNPWLVAPARPDPDIIDTVGVGVLSSPMALRPLNVLRESGASMAWPGAAAPAEEQLINLQMVPMGTPGRRKASAEPSQPSSSSSGSGVPWGWVLGGGAAILALGVAAVVVVSGKATRAKRRPRRRR